MKKTRQIVTLITAFSFLLSSMPVYAVEDNDTGDNVNTNITENKSDDKEVSESETLKEKKNIDNWLNEVQVKEKEYDGTNLCEIDCSSINLRIKNELHLNAVVSAAGYFERSDASDNQIKVIVKDFIVEGEDAEYLEFNSSFQTERWSKINKKTVALKTETEKICYGQQCPDSFSLICLDTDIPEYVQIPDSISVKNKEYDDFGRLKIRSYDYDDISSGSPNYSFIVNEGRKFEVVEYSVEKSATGSSENDSYFSDECILTAPEGFQISTDNRKFSDTVKVKLSETNGNAKKTVSYYLKNINEESAEFGSVTGEKKYSYLCVYNLPILEKPVFTRLIDISKYDSLNVLKKAGLFSSSTIKINLTAKGRYINKNNVFFTIHSENEETEDIILPAEITQDGDQSIFKAEYEYIPEEGSNYKDYVLTISVSNDAGDTPEVSAVPAEEAENHLIIDKTAPVIRDTDVTITYVNDQNYKNADNINSSKGFFVADGLINDSESGVMKLEYWWDFSNAEKITYDLYNNSRIYYKNNNPFYYEGTEAQKQIERSSKARAKGFKNIYSEKNTDEKNVHFRILVPYNNSNAVPNGIHTLFMKVTNYAGVSETYSGQYNSGTMDTIPPVLNRINIESTSGIKVLKSGNYSKTPIKFTFDAVDTGENPLKYSGVDTYAIVNDEKYELNKHVSDPEETVQSIELINSMVSTNTKFYVSDAEGNDIEESAKDEIKRILEDESIPAENKPGPEFSDISSNDFIVENIAPDAKDEIESNSVIFTKGNESLNDSDKKIYIYRSEAEDGVISDDVWYGPGNTGVPFRFTDKISGLNSVDVKLYKDNSVIKTSYTENNNNLSVRKYNSEYTDNVKDLTSGTYYYSVNVSDNAGNKYSKTDFRTINVDYTAPEGEITVSSLNNPVVKTGSGDDEKFWVDKDDEFVFKVKGSDDYSGVKKISVFVNDVEFDFKNKNEYSYFDSRSDSQILTIKKSELNDQKIFMRPDHTYTIKTIVTDFAENHSKESEFTLHIDEENPHIDSVEVKKLVTPENETGGKLNLLDFGIFSNASVTFSVKVSDKEFDSGIDSVSAVFWEAASAENEDDSTSSLVISVDKDNITYNEETGCYEFTVRLINNVVFNKNLKLIVKDKYGKISSEYEKIVLKSGEEEKSTVSREEKTNDYIENYVNVILEDIVPDMNIVLTVPDYIDKDNRIWFNDISKAVLLNVQDIDSGLRRVSVFLNDINHISDFDETELCNEPDARITNQYGYRFFTGMGYTDESDYPADGRFVYKFESEDNAGNKTLYPKVNNIDYISPDDINHIEEDEGGNKTAYAKQYTYYIDRYAPDVKNVVFEPVTVDGKENTESFKEEPEIFLIDDLYYGLFFNNDFDLKVYPEDHGPSSGLRCVNYRLISYETPDDPVKTDEGESAVNEEGYAVIHISKGFKGRIILSATDNVGNTSPEQYMDAYISEDKAPDLSINFMNETKLHDGDGNELYTEDVTVEVTVTDIQSGIRSCKVDISSEKTGENGFSEIINITDLINAGESGSFNGWHIEKTEANLITEIRKSFVFSSDDNNIRLHATAQDNCFNEISEPVSSRTFTIDKTDPVINVSYTDGFNGTEYYNKDNKAVITLDITERNFDSGLIKTRIENSFNGNVPSVEFSSSSSDKHKAVLTFSEGDYIFSVSGSDLAGHNASVNAPYEGTRRFFVDETDPDVTTNFDKFVYEDKDIFFNSPQKGSVTVREHNFDQNKINLKLMTKQPGSDHSEYNMNDNVYSFVKYSDWKTNESDPDLHTLEFELDKDNVYQLIITPEDKAGNKGTAAKSSVFEIDTTLPTVTKKNDQFVSGKENETEFLDIYTESRSGEPAPTIEFDDTNFDHLEYSLVKYVPDGKENRELGKIEAKSESGIVSDKKYTLEKFDEDGTYYVEIKAVDKAGNSSVINKNTYVRMNEKEVLAYIPDSSIERKSGIFSLEYENGDAISMRPESFSDIDIVVMAKDKSDVKILLRDMNGDEKDTMLSPESEDESMYGVGVYTYKLKREFFIDNYQNDTDSELNLSVKNGDDRIDLARIHIDNISPTGDTDSKFKSWHWYPGKEPQNIVVSNISELLNVDECKVYDKGEEIPFEYSEADKTISFILDEGWHDIGVHLEDYAGNKFDIQQVDNIHVGYFWLWVILGGVMATGGTAAFILLRKKFKK